MQECFADDAEAQALQANLAEGRACTADLTALRVDETRLVTALVLHSGSIEDVAVVNEAVLQHQGSYGLLWV